MLRHLHFCFDAVPHTPLLVIPSQVGSSPSCLFFLRFYSMLSASQPFILILSQSGSQSLGLPVSQSLTHSVTQSKNQLATQKVHGQLANKSNGKYYPPDE